MMIWTRITHLPAAGRDYRIFTIIFIWRSYKKIIKIRPHPCPSPGRRGK
jgi:hypothetical protein